MQPDPTTRHFLPLDGQPGRARRYTGTAQALHWLTVLLVATILPVAWVMTSLARGSPSRDGLFTFHKSLGVTILAVIVIRLVWRAMHPAPPETQIPPTLALIGRISHWLIYAIFIVMPVSGYVMSTAGGHPVSYFGLFSLPPLRTNGEVGETAETIHLLGQWAVYVLLGLHILASAWHAAIRRDGTLERMLPAQRVEGSGAETGFR